MLFYFDDNCKLLENILGCEIHSSSSFWITYPQEDKVSILNYLKDLCCDFYVYAILLDDDSYGVKISERIVLFKRAFGKNNLSKLKASIVEKSDFSYGVKKVFVDIALFNESSFEEFDEFLRFVFLGKGTIFLSKEKLTSPALSKISNDFYTCRSMYDFSKDKDDIKWQENNKYFFNSFYMTVKTTGSLFFLVGNDLSEKKYISLIGDGDISVFKENNNCREIIELETEIKNFSYYPIVPRATI